jgi:glycosyltransferase involved in cell wall biosynthesis
MIGTRVTHDVNSLYTWLTFVLRMMWIHFTHDWYTCYTWCEFILHMISIRVTHDVNLFYTWLAYMLHIMSIHFTHDWHMCYTWCEFIMLHILGPYSSNVVQLNFCTREDVYSDQGYSFHGNICTFKVGNACSVGMCYTFIKP